MKKLLTIFIILLLASCHKQYNVKIEIETLENILKEDNTNEDAYISLFNAYIIDDEYFKALRTLDKSLKNSEGIKTKELIDDLKDGRDIYDSNNTFYKRVLIDYDINFDPFYEDKRNIDYYQGNTPRIGGNFDSAYYVSEYLSSNYQKLFKDSNYTIYLLNKNNNITDVYQYTYSVSGKSFTTVEENHYKVKYNNDSINYTRDDGLTYFFKDEKIIKFEYLNKQNNINENVYFEYDENGFLSKLIENTDAGIITTEFERSEDGSPLKITRYSNLKEIKESNIKSRTIKEICEYANDGRMLSRIEYFNGELSSNDTFEFDSNNRLIYEKGVDYINAEYNREYTYIYNNDGYLDQRNNLINTNQYKKYIYNDDYSEVSICTIDEKSRDCQQIKLYH